MNKILATTALFTSLMVCNTIQAQSFSDIFNKDAVKDAITSVTGGQKLTPANISGTWDYVKPAIQLAGDNTFKDIAGAAATASFETKLSAYCAKVGISPGVFKYTFNTDMTFVCLLKGKELKGTYTIDEINKIITLKYRALGKINIGNMPASATLLGESMSLTFKADKLLSFFKMISSITSSKAISAISKLSDEYDGISIGFELKKSDSPAAVTAPQKDKNPLGKWF